MSKTRTLAENCRREFAVSPGRLLGGPREGVGAATVSLRLGIKLRPLEERNCVGGGLEKPAENRKREAN